MKLAFTLVAAAVLAGSALAAPKSATLTIRHQLHGCHSWSFDGSSWKASQSITLARGATIKVIDNDVMSHTLVQVKGPKASATGAKMSRIGATAHVTFPSAGTYVFTTKPGEDYMKGVTTIGEDNVLRLVVKVA